MFLNNFPKTNYYVIFKIQILFSSQVVFTEMADNPNLRIVHGTENKKFFRIFLTNAPQCPNGILCWSTAAKNAFFEAVKVCREGDLAAESFVRAVNQPVNQPEAKQQDQPKQSTSSQLTTKKKQKRNAYAHLKKKNKQIKKRLLIAAATGGANVDADHAPVAD